MKNALLTAALLVTACNLAAGIVYAAARAEGGEGLWINLFDAFERRLRLRRQMHRR